MLRIAEDDCSFSVGSADTQEEIVKAIMRKL